MNGALKVPEQIDSEAMEGETEAAQEGFYNNIVTVIQPSTLESQPNIANSAIKIADQHASAGEQNALWKSLCTKGQIFRAITRLTLVAMSHAG